MGKTEENIGTSRNVENEIVELNLGLSLNGESGRSQGSIASSVVEVETQKPPTQEKNIAIEKLRNFALNNMVVVFTRGEGPNGKNTEGLLYSGKKRDEVKIVCLCHGHFLNATEFVEHAGGGDVENPFKHIFIDGNRLSSFNINVI